MFYITSAMLFSATLLRAMLTLSHSKVQVRSLALLLAWLLLFVTVEFVAPRSRWVFMPYLLLQTAIAYTLLSQGPASDFFAALLAVLSMQLVQRWSLGVARIVIGLFVPLVALGIYRSYDPVSTLVSALTYGAVAGVTAFYAWSAAQAKREGSRAEMLANRLSAANLRLRSQSERIARLSVARERNRIARELHDSVTQTIFAMTLASSSLALIAPDDCSRIDAELGRIAALAKSALAEMHVLVSQLRPEVPEDDLALALQRHASERMARDGLSVALEVVGSYRLTTAEAQNLLRVAQEALNNVAKHAGTSAATLRLRLDESPQMEIRDEGRGFDPTAVDSTTGIGLSTMRERAAEIGWELAISSAPKEGTVITMKRSRQATKRLP